MRFIVFLSLFVTFSFGILQAESTIPFISDMDFWSKVILALLGGAFSVFVAIMTWHFKTKEKIYKLQFESLENKMTAVIEKTFLTINDNAYKTLNCITVTTEKNKEEIEIIKTNHTKLLNKIDSIETCLNHIVDTKIEKERYANEFDSLWSYQKTYFKTCPEVELFSRMVYIDFKDFVLWVHDKDMSNIDLAAIRERGLSLIDGLNDTCKSCLDRGIDDIMVIFQPSCHEYFVRISEIFNGKPNSKSYRFQHASLEFLAEILGMLHEIYVLHKLMDEKGDCSE